MNKYKAVKTWKDGVCFDSKKEAAYYENLKHMLGANEIAGYLVHGKMICIYGGDNSRDRAVTYEPDFVILNNDGTYKIVDVKSEATVTRAFLNKMKALKEKMPKVTVHLDK